MNVECTLLCGRSRKKDFYYLSERNILFQITESVRILQFLVRHLNGTLIYYVHENIYEFKSLCQGIFSFRKTYFTKMSVLKVSLSPIKPVVDLTDDDIQYMQVFYVLFFLTFEFHCNHVIFLFANMSLKLVKNIDNIYRVI